MFTINDLERIIATRADERAENSYTAKLLGKGVEKCAEKFGEEAIEAIIAAATRDKQSLTGEAADVVYHLLVMLHSAGVPYDDVINELERRTGQSGLAEKASRGET